MSGSGNGYNGFSKSNNACAAEDSGKFPASVAARMLGVPVEFVLDFGAAEWHHTSKFYNQTKYFDVEAIREHLATPEGSAKLAALKTHLKAKKLETCTIYENCTVSWIEWSGSRNYPKATKRTENGCQVSIKRQTAVIILPNFSMIRKRVDTKGFCFENEAGSFYNGSWHKKFRKEEVA